VTIKAVGAIATGLVGNAAGGVRQY